MSNANACSVKMLLAEHHRLVLVGCSHTFMYCSYIRNCYIFKYKAFIFYHFNRLFLFIYCVKVKKKKYKDIYCNFVTLQPVLVSFFTRVFLSIPYKQGFEWRLFKEIAKSLRLCPYFKVNIIHNNTVWLMTSYTNMLSGWEKGCTLDLKCL